MFFVIKVVLAYLASAAFTAGVVHSVQKDKDWFVACVLGLIFPLTIAGYLGTVPRKVITHQAPRGQLPKARTHKE